jgi:hypothetical protein
MLIFIGNHIKRTLQKVGKHQRCNQKRKSKNRQYNGQHKYDKQKTNNNLQTQHRKLRHR